MAVTVTLATVCNLSGQWSCMDDADSITAAVSFIGGSEGSCFLQNGDGQAWAKSVRLSNPWAAADGFDGYLYCQARVASDNFRMSLDAQTEALSGRVPITGSATFVNPSGVAETGVYLTEREVTLRFPQLTTTSNCIVEVTYRVAFSAYASGVNGTSLSAGSWLRVTLVPFSSPSGAIGVSEASQAGPPHAQPEIPISFYPLSATKGIKTLRFRTALQMNAAGEVFATYVVSGQIFAGIVVHPPINALVSTDVRASAKCDMYFVGARVVCPDEEDEHEVPTTIHAARRGVDYWQLIENCRTNGLPVTECTNILNVSLPVMPTPEEMFAEPADANVFLGQNVAIEFSPALLMALSNDTPAEVQWYRSGDSAQLLPGETNAVLTLTNAALSDGGSYYAVLTNDSGSVTSRIATLTVSLPPPFLQLDLVSGRRVLKVGGTVGSTYRIEHAENLGSTNWSRLLDLTLDVSPSIFEDTNAPSPRRFYRAVLLP